MVGNDSNYHDYKKATKCYFCGCGPPLREHHIIPQRFDGPDSYGNIVELCDLCHQKIERLYDKKFYEWFGIEDRKGERKFHRPCQAPGCGNRAKTEIVHILCEYSPSSNVIIKQTDKTSLRCRPCAVKLANEKYDELVKEYKYRLTEYNKDRRDLHRLARAKYDQNRTLYDYHNYRRLQKSISKPEPPDCTAEQLLDIIVIADESNLLCN